MLHPERGSRGEEGANNHRIYSFDINLSSTTQETRTFRCRLDGSEGKKGRFLPLNLSSSRRISSGNPAASLESPVADNARRSLAFL